MARPVIVLQNYWNVSTVDAARVEMQALMLECHDRGEGGDNRTLGASRLARLHPERYPHILKFERDPILRRTAAHHLRLERVSVDVLASTTGTGAASGGGWHKDQQARGFKALMYLDDVDASNGPFAMLLDYRDAMVQPLPGRLGRRYSDAAIVAAIKGGARVRTFHAPRGTVILFETSNIHRGTPCERGVRHTLTNYYENTPNACSRTVAPSVQARPSRRTSRSLLSRMWATIGAPGGTASGPRQAGNGAGWASHDS